MAPSNTQPGKAGGEVNPTMVSVSSSTYDLWYDAAGVDADLVVECWISHGPRADDATFDPEVGDVVFVGDEEEPPIQARVVRRQDDRVAVQCNSRTHRTQGAATRVDPPFVGAEPSGARSQCLSRAVRDDEQPGAACASILARAR